MSKMVGGRAQGMWLSGKGVSKVLRKAIRVHGGNDNHQKIGQKRPRNRHMWLTNSNEDVSFCTESKTEVCFTHNTEKRGNQHVTGQDKCRCYHRHYLGCMTGQKIQQEKGNGQGSIMIPPRGTKNWAYGRRGIERGCVTATVRVKKRTLWVCRKVIWQGRVLSCFSSDTEVARQHDSGAYSLKKPLIMA